MKTILQDIQNRLSAEIPTLKYIDEDWGQLDYFMPAPPVKFPCALININNVVYSNQGALIQQGLATITITVCDVKLTNTSTQAPIMQKQNAWKVYDTINSVVKALHGWSGSDAASDERTMHYGRLSRTQMNRRKNDDGINLFDIIFTTNINDKTAQKMYGKMQNVGVTVAPELKK
jgi:hypothetical protein